MPDTSVLLLTENAGVGGINTYTMFLAKGLTDYGFAVDIASIWPKPSNWLNHQCLKNGLPLDVLATRRSVLEFPRCIHKLIHKIKQRNYDIIHTQGNYSGLVGKMAYLLSGKRVRLVATVHSMIDDSRLWAKLFIWIDRKSFRWNHATIASSQYVLHRLQLLNVKISNPTFILHGIATQEDATTIKGKQSKKTYLRGGIPCIVFIGRLSFEKNCITLIEAADILKKQGKLFNIIIVGDGPQRPYLEGEVLAHGLKKYFRFEGWQFDVTSYYQSADVIAVPSIYESIGLTIMEAMLQGCPVVASNVQGVPEIIRNHQTGLLVKPKDAAELARALELCWSDTCLLSALGEAGRKYVLENHTIENMVAHTIESYNKALMM